MNNKTIELKKISISFDDKKTFTLKNITFGVNKGEILSIIGINGSGKSTLLKIIAGIHKNYSGAIQKNYKHLSYVPQKIDIDKTFPVKVEEFIKIYNKGIKNTEINNYFKKFNANDLINKNISTLSGGEFQKVLIINAIISKPELILLDEPTAGIDLVGEEIFYKIIADVKKIFPELSIILVSHNINLVYKNSDKVICLHKNNFCCHGTPSELKNNTEISKIFGEYLLPYKHNPHKKNNH